MSQLSKVWFIWFLMHFVGIMKVKNEFLVILDSVVFFLWYYVSFGVF